MDQERDQRLRQAMQSAKLDGVVAWRVEEIVLCTGGNPHLGMTFCFYPAEGDPIIYTSPNEPEDTIPTGFRRQHYDDFESLKQLLHKAMGARQHIGYALGAGRYALPGYAAEAQVVEREIPATLLADVEAVPADDFFAAQYLRKTSTEVEHIRKANALAALGINRFFELLEPVLLRGNLG